MIRLFALAAALLGSLELAAAVTGHVMDEQGKPIAKARIRAFALESSHEATARLTLAEPEPKPLATTESDERGAFSIDTQRQPVVMLVIDAPGRALIVEEVADGASAGAFLLRAAPSKKGRITANGRPVAGALVVLHNYYFARSDERGEYTAPDPGEWASTMTVLHPDFAMVHRNRSRDPLALDVALESGRAVRGRVVDAKDQPVANAIVRHGIWPLAKSGEDGSFAIAHLPSDAEVLRATKSGLTGTAKPGAATIALHPGATVTGVVRSKKDQQPVAGMKVVVRDASGPAFAPIVITDAKGNFAVDGLQAGTVNLSFIHPAFFATGTDAQGGEGSRTERAIEAVPFARVSGTVIDQEKRPVAAARVGVAGMSRGSFTAPDGTFVTRVPPLERTVSLQASKDAFATVSHGPLTIEPGEVRTGVRIVLPRGTRFEVRLVDSAGVPVAGERVVITRRFPDNPRPWRLGVHCGPSFEPAPCVSDEEGKVVVNLVDGEYDLQAGGEITVFKELRAQQLSASTSPLTIELERGAAVEGRVVWSDGTPFDANANVVVHGIQRAGAPVTNGAFTLRNPPPGKLLLSVRVMGPFSTESEAVAVIAPATGVVLEVERPGRISGRITDAENQRPVRQFTVATHGSSGARRGSTSRTITADDGRFELEDVPPGTYDVVVTSPGYARGSANAVEVTSGKSATVDLALDRGATVVGRVTSAGQAVSGATVIGGEGGGRRAQTAQTDANGEFVLDTLAAGSVELTVRKQGFVAKTVSVTAVKGKETRADVELSRGRELQGRVIDAAGQPVVGAAVRYRPLNASQPPAAPEPLFSDASGEFRLQGLPDESVLVIARKEGYAEASAEANPNAGTTITLTLGRGGTISGRVIGLPQAEVSLVEVHAMGRGGMLGRTSVHANGAFSISGVPDGTVTLSAQQTHPVRRTVRSAPVTITGGLAPFVEIDFAAGVTVRGVVTRNGQPVRGLINFDGMSADRARGRTAGSDVAPDGTYEARVPATGEYRVYVTPAGSGTINTGSVDVRGEMRHDVDLSGATVRGRIVDVVSGEPIANVRVDLISPGRGTDRVTDSSGLFSFEFVPDGTHTLRAYRDGYSPESREIVVTNAATPEIVMSLARGELVTIRVTDAGTGQNVAAFLVMATANGAPTGTPQRMRDGMARYWLRPGTYSLRVVADGYQPKVVPVTVPGPPELHVELSRVAR